MKIAAATKNPQRVLGLHFFNPVPVLPLVELVSTLVTSEAAAARTEQFASAVLGKQVVRCSDRSGFVVNALLVPYLLSAIRMVEAGVATVEDIDKAVVAGLSHPMGPLRLSDLIGLDTLKLIADKMFEEFKEPHTARRRCCSGWSRRACWARSPARASTRTDEQLTVGKNLRSLASLSGGGPTGPGRVRWPRLRGRRTCEHAAARPYCTEQRVVPNVISLMSENGLSPYYEESQSIYDISDEFFALFLGPTMGYTCAYFERDDMTLDEAQNAKFDLALGKLNLEPGMTLLDIGCGWGGALRAGRREVRRQRHRHHAEQEPVRVQQASGWPGIPTPSAPSRSGCRAGRSSTTRSTGSCSIGAFEAFKVERYPLFFEKAYNILPDDGRMLLHTILAHTQKFFRDNGIKLTISDLKFMQFIGDEIFPGGQLPAVEDIEKLAADSGFTLERTHLLQPHYARTLDMWAANLEASQGRGDRHAPRRRSTTGT